MNPSAGNGTIPFSHLFQENRPHNRLEMISDFVDDVDVEIVASLKVRAILKHSQVPVTSPCHIFWV